MRSSFVIAPSLPVPRGGVKLHSPPRFTAKHHDFGDSLDSDEIGLADFASLR
jgi:hypothetical protein